MSTWQGTRRLGLGGSGLDPGPPQHSVFPGNELSTPSLCSPKPQVTSPGSSSATACTNVAGQQVGGKENPSSMLTILIKSFLNIEKPEYLFGEGNIMIL